MNYFLRAASKTEYIVLFLLNFLFLLLYLLVFSPYHEFYYDSNLYFWELGNSFEKSGKFDLLNYSETWRGLYFPLLNYVIIKISNIFSLNTIVISKIVTATYITVFSNVLLPLFLKKAYLIKCLVWQILLFDLLLYFFWKGYFNFPLTDFISLFLLFAALYFWLLSAYIPSFFSGIAFILAINLRPVYIISVFLFVGWVLLEIIRKQVPLKRTLYKLLFLILGAVISSLPQVYVNYHKHTIISPLVQTNIKYEGNLYLQQLKWGIFVQKYETNLGSDYPEATVRFIGKEGEFLYYKKEQGDAIATYGEYFRLLLKYPYDFAIIYSKHIFNGLDINYPTPYILSMHDYSFLLSLLNYSLLFVFLIILLISYPYTNITIRQWQLLIILLSPFLVVIPTAIEVRFFLPLHLLIYCTVIFYNYNKITVYLNRRNIFRISFVYILFLLACFNFSSNAYANLEYPIVKSYNF